MTWHGEGEHGGARDSSDEYLDHMRRIARIIDDWRRGQITVSQKRASVAAENMAYYGGPIKSPTTGEPLCAPPKRGDPSIAVLADATGIPFEAAAAALACWRRGNFEAANASTLAESREMAQSGYEGYRSILKAARPGRVPERAAPPPGPPEPGEVQETMNW